MLLLIHSIFFFISMLHVSLSATQINTFYGPVDIEEEVLLELIESPAFQRLKSINQYGVAYYTTHCEKYTRYDHSLGVFAILRAKQASLEEQIAGLLHDVSHTVFSHVGDWIFGKAHQEKDYQSSIHTQYVQKSGLEKILVKYGYTAQQFLPTEETYPMLEQKGPNLCADRIDYNLQGAFYRNYITHEEAIELFQDLQFSEGHWISSKWNILKKLVRFSLFMTENCWGSAGNHFSSRWLAEALLRAISIGCISWEDIHFSTDDLVWKALNDSLDPVIRTKLIMTLHTQDFYRVVSLKEADFVIVSKFRGIDPWVISHEKLVRLTSTDATLAEEYSTVKTRVLQGWPVILLP